MDYADLSPHRSSGRVPVLAVGWRRDVPEVCTGDVPESFIERLWVFCNCPSYLWSGAIGCVFCDPSSDNPIEVVYRNQPVLLGLGEIRVFGCNGRIFASPDMIFHYVSDHKYKPPDEFINAVMNGPLPDSIAYIEMLKSIGLRPFPPVRALKKTGKFLRLVREGESM